MKEPGVYIIRIYRCDSVNVAGVVEAVTSGRQMPFYTMDELWRALRELPTPRRILPTDPEFKENPP